MLLAHKGIRQMRLRRRAARSGHREIDLRSQRFTRSLPTIRLSNWSIHLMESGVLILLGAIVMVAGALVAISAPRLPVRQIILDRCAASFLVSGIALIALMFPMI